MPQDPKPISSLFMTTVNAPYCGDLSAEGLGRAILSVEAAKESFGQVFSFFTEIPLHLQEGFIKEQGLPREEVLEVARYVQDGCPYPLALLPRTDSGNE